MDTQRIVDLLAGTVNPDQKVREPAEQTLEQIHKIIGFTPKLLEIALDNNQQISVKQAAVIYLKNNVSKYYDKLYPEDKETFTIHDSDKTLLRNSIVDAIVRVDEDKICVHLVAACNVILKNDFPHKWPGVVNQIHFLLQQNDFKSLNAALLVFYQLARIYEYKNTKDREPFVEALKILLPATSQRMAQILQNDPLSETSCKLQKHILKVFHSIIQYSLPTSILTQEVFSQWMTYFIEIGKRDIPDEVQKDVMNDDKPQLVWWKCKKWAFHLQVRIFERYGLPNNVAKEYKQFSEWFIKTFSYAVIQTVMKTLELYAYGRYVSPRVLQRALNYLNTAVLHSMTWKMLKDDMMVVVSKIIFPLLSFSEEDEELWEADPREYIRIKFDIFEEYVSPVSASQTLLHSLCKKRKLMLEETMKFVINVLNNPQSDPRAKDGALHMVGSVAGLLLKKDAYKAQLEQLIANYVLPLFASQSGFLRARACWVLSYFYNVEFKTPGTGFAVAQAILQCVLVDRELPVKVEAALCLQSLFGSKNEYLANQVQEVTKPNVKALAAELVQMIKSTGSEDVMEVMQKIVYLFPNELAPVAVEMVNHLAQTFHQLVTTQEDGEDDEKISAAMAVLTTIDTILTVLDDHKEVFRNLEPIVVSIVTTIFDKSVMELYEDATTLLSTITSDYVSKEAWGAFQTLYHVFKRDGCDYFTDIMSPLHNYITVDPNTFLASRDNLAAIYEMCHQILTDPQSGEETETYAAKLLEVVILQFRNQIDHCIPTFIELAITRLKRDISTTELRTLLIQMIIAAFYSNYELLFNCFEKMQAQNNLPQFSLFDSFVKLWFKDIKEFVGLHDRKMCIIGISSMIALPSNKRPPVVEEIAPQVVPAVLMLYDRLKIAYKKNCEEGKSESDTDDDDDEDEDSEPEALDDDQDHISPNAQNDDENDDDFEDIADDDDDGDESFEDYEEDSEDDCEHTALETFETLIDTKNGFVDEFVLFKNSMEKVRTEDPALFGKLMNHLDQAQHKKLMELGQYQIPHNPKNN